MDSEKETNFNFTIPIRYKKRTIELVPETITQAIDEHGLCIDAFDVHCFAPADFPYEKTTITVRGEVLRLLGHR